MACWRGICLPCRRLSGDGTWWCKGDGSGRILIPPSLREYAALTRTAMLIGQGNRFELWDETQWNQSCQQWLKADESGEPLPPELESLSL